MPSYNTSTIGVNTMATFMPLEVIILIFLVAIIAGVFIMGFGSLARYKRLIKTYHWLGKCINYFGYGLFGWGAFVGLYITSLWIASIAKAPDAGQNAGIIASIILFAIAFFFGTAAMGYWIKRAYGWVINRKKKYKAVALVYKPVR